GTQSRVTFLMEGARSPVWSPDGRYLAFSSMIGNGVFVQEINESGKAEQLFGHHAAIADSWSPDGRYLLFTQDKNRFDRPVNTGPGCGASWPYLILSARNVGTRSRSPRPSSMRCMHRWHRTLAGLLMTRTRRAGRKFTFARSRPAMAALGSD